MKRLSLFALCVFRIGVCGANECLRLKTVPSVEIKEPEWSVSIVQPENKLSLLHGNVISTFAEEYEITYGAQKVSGGWCVMIENIEALMGYRGFVIQIDRRHNKGGCEWNAIKEHEDEHIRAHLSVVSDNRSEIKRSISAAAGTILPVFVETDGEIGRAMDELQTELQNAPQIRLLRQALSAEQEIRNRKVDLQDKGARIGECGKI